MIYVDNPLMQISIILPNKNFLCLPQMYYFALYCTLMKLTNNVVKYQNLKVTKKEKLRLSDRKRNQV